MTARFVALPGASGMIINVDAIRTIDNRGDWSSRLHYIDMGGPHAIEVRGQTTADLIVALFGLPTEERAAGEFWKRQTLRALCGCVAADCARHGAYDPAEAARVAEVRALDTRRAGE